MSASTAPSLEPPRVSVFRILHNALTGHTNRAEIALQAAVDLGDVLRVPFPGKRVYLVSHPDHVRHILVTNQANYKKSFDYGVLARVLGQGLLTIEGDLWQAERRLQQPIFHGAVLNEFQTTMADCTRALLDSWHPGDEIVLEHEMTRYALHVIGQRVLSLDVRDESHRIIEYLDYCNKRTLEQAQSLFRLPPWVLTPGEARFRRSLRSLHRIVEGLIDRRAQNQGDPYDLYQVLVTTPGYARERLRDQIVSMFMIGHETTAVALTWCLYCLARHPEVEARVHDEALEVVAGATPTRDELGRLTYTKQVIDESLRLYPPVPFVGRESLSDDVIGGYTIPAGSTFVICPYVTQRRPDLWDEPNRFDPERFHESRKDSALNCFPFGAGPRGCAGVQFAMMEMLTFIGAMAKRLRLQSVDPSPLYGVPLVSLRPSRPVRMRIEAW
jgi:cytochrome P450